MPIKIINPTSPKHPTRMKRYAGLLQNEVIEVVDKKPYDNKRYIYLADFKFTSQANHMSKLQELKKQYTTEGFHKQRLYKRRKKDKDGIMRSTFGKIMEPL